MQEPKACWRHGDLYVLGTQKPKRSREAESFTDCTHAPVLWLVMFSGLALAQSKNVQLEKKKNDSLDLFFLEWLGV